MSKKSKKLKDSFLERIAEPIRGILASCGCATQGIGFAARAQRNLRVHFSAAVIVIGAGLWLHLSRVEMAILLLTVSLVIMGELLNTALEYLLNLMEARHHPTVRAVKDIAAGAIFMSVLGAIGVGILLLGPRLLALWRCR